MPKYCVYAEARGTFFCVVEADSPKEAREKAEDFELTDDPEVGDITDVELEEEEPQLTAHKPKEQPG